MFLILKNQRLEHITEVVIDFFLFNLGGISIDGCLIQMFCLHFVGAFQTTLLLWMALDRYFAICRPLYYHKYMKIPNFVKSVVVPVIRNGLLIVTMVSLAGKLTFCVTNVIDHCFCEYMALVQLACGDITINNIVGLSTAQMKAINTCITHLIVISGSLIFALIAFMSYRIRKKNSSRSHVFVSTMYLLFPSCFNPVVYGVRTKEMTKVLQFSNTKVFPLYNI
uniref:G-protein coupled receptors family 1 profile domain-containing protein n=1 Tax=Sinocyclocheilus grahami TaxID=75366 RepID=A0A672KTR6_SINGR